MIRTILHHLLCFFPFDFTFCPAAFCTIYILRKHRNKLKAFTFRKSEHQIHILNRLSCRSFNQIIDRSHHNNPICPWIDLKPDIDIITSFHPFRFRSYVFLKHTHKFFTAIIFIIYSLYVFIAYFFRKFCILCN